LLKNFLSKYTRFALAGLTGAGINLVILYFLNVDLGVYVIYAESIAIGITSFWNFVLNVILGVIEVKN